MNIGKVKQQFTYSNILFSEALFSINLCSIEYCSIPQKLYQHS